ncbi:MAG: flagellin [Verrucomicrobia bacterium]|nr:flagellin [Verrucomicrobiota bacterium]
MVINTNIQAQINSDNLQTTQTRLSKSLARLSSGSRIIQPSDDAAGLAVASRIDAQINRIQAAKYNVNNAVSFVQNRTARRPIPIATCITRNSPSSRATSAPPPRRISTASACSPPPILRWRLIPTAPRSKWRALTWVSCPTRPSQILVPAG